MSTDSKKTQRFQPKLNTDKLTVTWNDKVTAKSLTVKFSDIAAKFQADSRSWFICKGIQILCETRNSQVSADGKLVGYAMTWKGVCQFGSSWKKPKVAKVPYTVEERAVARVMNCTPAWARGQKEGYSAKAWKKILDNAEVKLAIVAIKTEDNPVEGLNLDSLL